MFFVYAIYSEKFDKIYIGFSSDLEQRLISHNTLATKGWTLKYRPWVLFYFEEFNTKKEALQREKELKSYQGRKFLRSKLP